jgi:uncharacterized protein (DUF2267 family)
MDRNTFISQVRKRADLPDEAAAEKATQATLEVLGKRLYGGESSDLAAQLPDGIKDYLLPAETNQKFDRETFIHLVAEREGVSALTAKLHIKIVLSVLSEAVSTGEFQHVWSQLPNDFASLF